MILFISTWQYGGVAQLGEHLPCKQGVSGSIPLISIDIRNTFHFFDGMCFHHLWNEVMIDIRIRIK